MTLTALRPWRSFSDLDRMFDTVFTPPANTNTGWVPGLDVRSFEDRFVVELEVPGLSTEDINVDLDDDVLRISGERRFDKEGAHHVERRYGRFERALRLNVPVDQDAVEAELKDGVLRLTLPKAVEPPKARSIQIKS